MGQKWSGLLAWVTFSNSEHYFDERGQWPPIEKNGVSGAGFIAWVQDILVFFPPHVGVAVLAGRNILQIIPKRGPYAHGRGKFNSTHRSPQALQKFSIGGINHREKAARRVV